MANSGQSAIASGPSGSALRRFVQVRFDAWLARQVPPARRVRLTRNNVFIFPTRQGLMFGVMISLLLIAAINYENSLIYLLAFLMGGMFLICILETFRNLAGLTVEVGRAENNHAGAHVQIELRLDSAATRRHMGLFMGWPGETRVVLDLDEPSTRVHLGVRAPQRGRFRPPRLLIETFFPLGLLRAWCWIDLDCEVIVYPRPVFAPLPLLGDASDASLGFRVDRAAAEFHGLREYRSGDPVRGIAWRRYASTGELLTKEFASGVAAQELWFDWALLDGLEAEARLSHITGWVLTATREQRAFGLRMPGVVLPLADGDEQCRAALEGLALWGEVRAVDAPGEAAA